MTARLAVHMSGEEHGKMLLAAAGPGAVGHQAIPFTKMAGAHVITTVSDDEQAEVASAAGADVVLNDKTENVESTGSQERRVHGLIGSLNSDKLSEG